MSLIPLLDFDTAEFPPIEKALADPNGLLAAGGDLSVERLLEAYSQGIFPWYEKDQPILWWSPAPRAVIYTETFKPSKSLAKLIRKQPFNVTCDTAFEKVIRACSAPREYANDTWITEDMITAYTRLHYQGYAHSFECWEDSTLVGGLYGVSLGTLFFGESMFSTRNNSSKIAFCFLIDCCKKLGIPVIDCQVLNPHTESLGAVEVSRTAFKKILAENLSPPASTTLVSTTLVSTTFESGHNLSPFRGSWQNYLPKVQD